MCLSVCCVIPVHTITTFVQAAHLVADLPGAARHLPFHIHAQQGLLLAQAAQLRQHLQWAGGRGTSAAAQQTQHQLLQWSGSR